MFKYTPPWQALCNSMEHDVKRLSFSPSEDSDVLTQVFRSHQLSAPEISQRSAQEGATPHTSMDSLPRRWVIQAFSPRLEPTDLRTMLSPAASEPHRLNHSWSYSKSADSTTFSFDSISISRLQPSVVFSPQHKEESGDVVVQAKQVTVSEERCGADEDWEPSSPGSPSSSPGSPTSSAGSHCGFYSFVDDPTSPEAELNEAWMVSPERKAKLATLREEDAFKLQTYSKGRKPESLFQGSDEDSRYLVDDNEDQSVEQSEETQLRKEIILSQAPKQNDNFRKQWSALESLDPSNSPNKLVDGFSICFKPSNTKSPASPTAELCTVDDKQIDFSSAREQFRKMEQAGVNSSMYHPSSPKLQTKLYLEDIQVLSNTAKKDEHSLERLSQSATSIKQDENERSLTGRKVTVYRSDEKVSKRQSSVFDVLDSGLGDLLVDTSGGYGNDNVPSNDNIMSESRDARLTSGYDETPIEREIRIAQEREESLRRSRGITHSDVKGQMVEIKTSLLSQSTPPITPVKAKNRVSFLIQKEIEKDNRREEDLLSQGKEAGLYTRGTFQELEDRKRIFEQADKWEREEDKMTTAVKTLKERLGSGVEGGSGSSVFPSPCCPHRHPEETELYLIQKSSSPISSTPCGPGVQDLNKALPSLFPEERVKLKDNESVILNKPLVIVVDRATSISEITNGSPTSLEGTESTQTRASSRKVASSLWSSSFSSPSSTIPNDSAFLTSQPGGKAFEPRRRRLDSSGLQPWRSYEAPAVIQREIQEDLKREQELQEQRESRARLSPLEGSLDSIGRDVTDASELQSFPRSLVEQEESVYPESPRLPVEQTNKMVGNQHYSPITLASKFDKTNMSPVSPFPRPSGRLPCLSMVTAQPWASARPTSPVVSRAVGQGAEVGGTPTQKGLTETLLDDFEERRIKLKREEGSYAGIQPIDDVNSEVLEATRVTRHKSKFALRWEAGLVNADLAPSTVSS